MWLGSQVGLDRLHDLLTWQKYAASAAHLDAEGGGLSACLLAAEDLKPVQQANLR